MTPLKRKVSCTFKRETPLEVQERIYMLVWLPAPDGLVPLLVQEGIEGWSPDLGVVGASGPRYGVRRLDAAFLPASLCSPGTREQSSRSARRKQSFRTPRAVRKRRAVSKCRRVRKRTLRSPSQKPTAENRCRRYPLLI